jgi:hypothetical protein
MMMNSSSGEIGPKGWNPRNQMIQSKTDEVEKEVKRSLLRGSLYIFPGQPEVGNDLLNVR